MVSEATTVDPALAERVVARLRAHATRLRARGIGRLGLLGSIARGGVGAKSDLELLIEVDSDGHLSRFRSVDLQDDLQGQLGRRTHLAFAVKLRPWLCQEILAEAIPIF